MSRRETDREDLLREATALIERAELQVPGFDEPVIVGFRKDGAASVFFGADPVYQFNTAGELRRAYIGGLLYKAERGKLVSLRRERSETEVALIRRELAGDEAKSLLRSLNDRTMRLREALASGSFTLIGQAPAEADVTGRMRLWLARLPGSVLVAQAPNVR
jgi:hypothetical protein